MSSFLNLPSRSSSLLGQLTPYKLGFLFFGLALWLFLPIVGIFPLLFFIQLNIISKNGTIRQKNKKQNLLNLNNCLLLLIVLTLTIFISSFDPFKDTLIYIDDYSNLDDTSPFGIAKYGRGLEFVTFLLAYPTFILSNGSEYWFLFNHSLIINLLIVFFISRGLSKQYYPLILIFVFSINLYYGQVFYMRHFLSNVFLMLAVASLDRPRYFAATFLSIFSHLSNILYSLVTIVFKFDRLFLKFSRRLFKNRLLFNSLLFSLALGSGLIFKFYGSENIIGLIKPIIAWQSSLFNSDVGDYLQTRISNYDGRDSSEYSFPVMAIIDTVLIGLLIIIRNLKKADKKILCLVGLYCVYLLAFIFVALTGFNWRLCLLFFSLSGFFYLIGIEIDNRDVQLGLIFLALFKIAFFGFWLYKMDNQSYFVFFDAHPLEMTIYDYVVFFFDSITS